MPSFRSRVQPRNVYQDKKSVERGVGVKTKYKIAGYVSIFKGAGRVFWIVTTNKDAYPNRTTITIEQKHWMRKTPRVLTKNYSYASIEHYDIHTNQEINIKQKDSENGFNKVAILQREKFDELCSLRQKIKLTPTRTKEDMKFLITSTIHSEEKVDELLNQLGLK